MARVPRRRHRRGPPRFNQPIHRLIPNMLTMLALCAGLTALRYGVDGRYQLAVLAVVVAAVLDGLDGRIARLIGATSRFGAELDSLSDFACFGVVPAVLLYLWSMHGAGGLGWAIVLLYAVCTALRLARFNTATHDPEQPAWRANFFTGVPAPAGAGLALLPLIATFELGGGLALHPWLVGAWIVCVGALMVSQVPTFALKKLKVPHRLVGLVLLAVSAVTAALITEPWLTLLTLAIVYLGSIPLSLRAAGRLRASGGTRPSEVNSAARGA